MNDFNEFISKINKQDEVILEVKCIYELESIVLLKKNLLKSILFIEILDLINKQIKHIILDSNISFIKSFHPIDSDFFYINCTYKGESDCHLKINIEGNVLFNKKFDTEIHSMNHKINLKNFIFRKDLRVLYLNDFQEYDLCDFMINNFQEKYDFVYLYYSECRDTTFSFPYNNILGFEIYDKDGDAPRMYFLILKFDSPSDIKIVFDGKIDDCGNSYLLNQNATEIAYRSTWYLTEPNLKFRKLLPKEFINFEKLDYTSEYRNSNLEVEDYIYFDRNIIIIVYSNDFEKYDRIEILNRSNSNHEKKILYVDKGKLIQMMKEKLFFIKDSKLKYIEI